ncbi:MAG: DUF177 domain-containing protein [Alphaproteobacteria bacterium]|nr:DUF177 domain-containing protein [Alphaproteobacteria bacterium]
MTSDHALPPEFSRPVAADRVGRDGLDIEIEAGAAEREALARRFGLLALDVLRARCRLRPVAGGMIELTARFDASVVQECVVTLEPVPAQIHGSFDQRYALNPAVLRSVVAEEDEMFDPEADDPPEALAEGAIDLGEAVAQQLAVSLDPYPRAPGAELAVPRAGEDGGQEIPGEPEPPGGPNPFAALGKLRK